MIRPCSVGKGDNFPRGVSFERNKTDALVYIQADIGINRGKFKRKKIDALVYSQGSVVNLNLNKYYLNICQILVVGGGQWAGRGLWFTEGISRQLSGCRYCTLD